MSSRHELGRQAEDLAADYLRNKGYTIVTRRYRAKGGEIDVVALDGDVLVFAEVRYRTNTGAPPEESLTDRKLARIALAAEQYLIEAEETERVARFDFVAVDGAEIRHIVDAFRP